LRTVEAAALHARWSVMEIVGVLRLLWRERILVLVAAIIAIGAGVALAYHIGFPPKLESRQYDVGIGTLEALVDTPSSLVVDLGGETGPDIPTLAGRATLLASLLTSSPLKEEIARRAGVDANELIAIPPSGATVDPSAAPSVSGTGAKLDDPNVSVLRAKVPTLESGEVPIIAVNAQAPDAAVAARLADQSIQVLQEHLRTVAAADKIPNARRVVVTELGPARATVESRGPERLMAIVAALFVFVLGCAAIVGVSALASGWRRAAAIELLPDEVAPWDLPSHGAFASERDAEDDRAGRRDDDGRGSRHDDSAEPRPARYPRAVGL
jgi:hypothetical protein